MALHILCSCAVKKLLTHSLSLWRLYHFDPHHTRGNPRQRFNDAINAYQWWKQDQNVKIKTKNN